jgi:pilus assembly protein Flp/PilA
MFLKAAGLWARMADKPRKARGREVWTSVKAKWNQGDRNMQRIRKLIRNSKGATAIEYGLIAALIAVAAITAMQGLGTSIRTTFNNAASAMNG